MTRRILVVEDEAPMRQGLVVLLAARGYDVLEAATGPEGLLKAREAAPHLILLDVMLPGASGFEVLQALRAEGRAVPVILLTAKGAETDKVLGFTLGVDDYITKPFSTLELLGRIEAVLRRCGPATAPATPLGRLDWGHASVDFPRGELRRDGQVVAVPPRALDLLAVLARADGQIVPREALLDAVFGEGQGSPRSVDNMVVKLRQALEEAPEQPRHLLTVHGKGYRLLPPGR